MGDRGEILMTQAVLNGNTYSDGISSEGGTVRNFGNGGHRQNFMLCLSDITTVAGQVQTNADQVEIDAAQVAADAAHYASRHPCVHLFCFIYDPEGRIGSPTRLETDLTSVSDSFTVDVLAAPK